MYCATSALSITPDFSSAHIHHTARQPKDRERTAAARRRVYTKPSVSTSSPARPRNPAICQHVGAVRDTQSDVVVPPGNMRPWLVVNRTKKIRV